jgi:ornithine decarboxylase
MVDQPRGMRMWVRRYLVAELAGTASALVAAVLTATADGAWSPERWALIVFAASLGETIGFYAGFLITRYLREDLAGSPRQRMGVIVAAAVVEFGPADVADTFLVRPAAMFVGSLISGNVIIGVLVGKLAADLVFYGLAITSYQVLVRRLLGRFRSAPQTHQAGMPEAAWDSPAAEPPSGPCLVMDLAEVGHRYQLFTEALPGLAVHFAVKCNPDAPLLRHLHEQGARFEVASYPELQALIDLGVQPEDVIFSNPVKPWWHIRDAHSAGVFRFGFDSDAELEKLARFAPGSAVFVRLAVAPAASEVPSEGKFGVDAETAGRLLRAAVDTGLRPWGIAFHVGSQMTDPGAWTAPIRASADLMRDLQRDGIRLAALDIGGGFPAHYGDPVPSIAAYGECIRSALTGLPYPVALVAEPGRGLVADAGRLETTVIGIASRGGQRWAHLDVGAFNGGMEALETSHRLVLPMTDSRGGPSARWNVTGPSCDSQDTLRFGAELSANLQEGDRVTLHTAGAYTTAYASAFNGFDVPTVRYELARPPSAVGERSTRIGPS